MKIKEDWWLLRFYDSANSINDNECRSGSLPEVLQYRIWPVSMTETFNTQVHWLNLKGNIKLNPPSEINPKSDSRSRSDGRSCRIEYSMKWPSNYLGLF